ncbi:type II toxin-antitoxin system Phd/YefM family antitoxin [Meiothermus taiwanensis]|uniref:Antitoxin n=2 Tax=Meiothermus taiwanensis TaxID=172827 RepID=A0A399E7U0_9DEIN|nr:type II toxin-antitoxin system prevent-host-death family antitoxin [Meiothermus taiwanensis]GIW30414.1 MAG: antitoxin [Meiothermus sp.]AWR87888.1 prevent-host-death family protein [Meiothermus taiwanensis WR-220]KIQ54422.1 prevent-host-death protein [Meiothermus taiwanensis]KZK16208.1 prevent-host-death family protein [Meiothermus taiwanensis]RIH79936.1 prevent-host-death family protein [Meiothermus taiwanensis]
MVTAHQAKQRFSELLERAHAGEEVVVSKCGKPYAKLAPLEPVDKVPLGFLKGSVEDAFFEPLPDEARVPGIVS